MIKACPLASESNIDKRQDARFMISAFYPNEINLKIAILVSIVLHIVFILNIYKAPMVRLKPEENKSIIVNYVKAEEPDKIQQKEDAVKVDEIVKIIDKEKIDVKKDNNMPAGDPDQEAKELSDNDARKELQIRSSKDYVNYYNIIREKIRHSIKERCRKFYIEGDVELYFTLSREGSLLSYEARSISPGDDNTFKSLAIGALKDAAPFMAFPKALSVSSVSFSLIVSFRK